MNKKLLSMAVAAAMVAPTAAMADAVLYGKLHMSIDWASVEGADTSGVKPKKFNGWGVNGGAGIPGEGRANRIGVKGSEDLGNGMKAIYQVEFGVKMTEESTTGNAASGSNDSITMRNSFVGLTGDWGTFVVGRNDTPYKTSTGKLDLFADTMADNNGTVGFDDVRADNAIAYVSPSLSGFQLAAAVHAGGASTVGYGENLNSDSLAEAYSIAGIYSNGPFYASLAYEALGNELYMDTVESLNKLIDDDYTKWRLGLGLMDWNGFTLTGIYEEQSNLPAGQLTPATDNEKLKIWQVQAGYSFGNSMVKAMYGSGNRDGRITVGAPKDIKDTVEGDYYTWALAFDHNLSKRTKAYVLYTQVNDDAPDSNWDGFSVGMIHNF
ncbi:porin [Allochromatium vinosum]|uniref:Porin Gram-negative type n=1 Tax=Allochromatium vinosum (strain ATCC 17899 / DSM 180 / NBRC 103801 / NCIMB 10441 / D) TaxID=572477 RepID=D3RQX0_ALLVD|nr:porin [Allochromatium vinosum]ADC63804.1 porin Gram-negative type [Allochromatium vinosum DSM 180]MBK1653763.1 porin [Allochromatium vinosum]